MFKLIIAGGRDFNNYEMLKYKVDTVLSKMPGDIVIVSGEARGADRLGELYAEEAGLKVDKFPADWDNFGKSAGYRRNVEMAEHADALVAFWNGESKGTKHMIDIAKEKGLQIRIIHYTENDLIKEDDCEYTGGCI